MTEEKIRVLCVDDNPHVAEALRIKLSEESDFSWMGWLPDADDLVSYAVKECPALVILDVDMPGRDAFDAMRELVTECPDTRVVLFSGHVRPDLITKAVEAGAWGYVSKNDGEGALVEVLRRVAEGEFALSPEVRATFDRE